MRNARTTTMTRLEPVFLSNVVLFFTSLDDVTSFGQVSKHALSALRILRKNPIFKSTSPFSCSRLLTVFPNINTLCLPSKQEFLSLANLPDTVTAIVIDRWYSGTEPPADSYVDRIVEIKSLFVDSYWNLVDLTPFPSLQRLVISGSPETITYPSHTLRRIRVQGRHVLDLAFQTSLQAAAETVQIVEESLSHDVLSSPKAPPFPTVKVFYCHLGHFTSPSQVWNLGETERSFLLFSLCTCDDIRTFNDAALLPLRSASVSCFNLEDPRLDFTFLRYLTRLRVDFVKRKALALPPTVVELEFQNSTGMTIAEGAENVTKLCMTGSSVKQPHLPRLCHIECVKNDVSVSFSQMNAETLTTVTQMRLDTKVLNPRLRLPPLVLDLCIGVHNTGWSDEVTSQLTNLQRLRVTQTPGWCDVDLRSLTNLTGFTAIRTFHGGLPSSLVSCSLITDDPVNCAHMTRLTRLKVQLKANELLELPTCLERLSLMAYDIPPGNVLVVPLKRLKIKLKKKIRLPEISKFSTTLQHISGTFYKRLDFDALRTVFPDLQVFKHDNK